MEPGAGTPAIPPADSSRTTGFAEQEELLVDIIRSGTKVEAEGVEDHLMTRREDPRPVDLKNMSSSRGLNDRASILAMETRHPEPILRYRKITRLPRPEFYPYFASRRIHLQFW